jgi:subtilase family serine protease
MGAPRRAGRARKREQGVGGGGELGGLDPQDLRSAYKIPTSGGADQTIALVDAFGYERAEADLATYRDRYGLGECTGPPPEGNGCFRKVNQAGEEANYPRETGEGWEVESALHMDMAAAACPHCHILLVQATSEAPRDLAQAVDTAARLGATEISNSYGFAEQECEPEESNCQEYSNDYQHPGVLVTASSGDTGYEDWLRFGTSTEFPAASPNVAAVGGTALRKASAAAASPSQSQAGRPTRAAPTGR